MAFGDKIRQIRKQKGLTQRQVNDVLGYQTLSYISDVELNKFVPQPDKLEKLGEALGLTLEEMEDLVLEERLERLGMTEPAFTMMFKEIPKMNKEEKQSLIRAYEAVLRARQAKKKT